MSSFGLNFKWCFKYKAYAGSRPSSLRCLSPNLNSRHFKDHFTNFSYFSSNPRTGHYFAAGISNPADSFLAAVQYPQTNWYSYSYYLGAKNTATAMAEDSPEGILDLELTIFKVDWRLDKHLGRRHLLIFFNCFEFYQVLVGAFGFWKHLCFRSFVLLIRC